MRDRLERGGGPYVCWFRHLCLGQNTIEIIEREKLYFSFDPPCSQFVNRDSTNFSFNCQESSFSSLPNLFLSSQLGPLSIFSLSNSIKIAFFCSLFNKITLKVFIFVTWGTIFRLLFMVLLNWTSDLLGGFLLGLLCF